LWRIIARTGRVTEPGPVAIQSGLPRPDAGRLRRSLQVRQVDAGSCNGCEAEFAAAFGPVYDAERFGVRLVASPRHADALVVTGPVTRNMLEPLRRTFEATPGPKYVVALGDCACNRGVFADGYGVAGAVGDVLPVDVEIVGCPPAPEVIVAHLRGLAGS
jgi:Ni,Fe-hydrogenase III small subunit